MVSSTHIKTFLGFAFLSGMGWICDFATYAFLVERLDQSPALANFISSYVGVTFVYATSLRLVFNKVTNNHTLFLSLYWGYQFVSISLYSGALSYVVNWVEGLSYLSAYGSNSGILGKIIITPINLFTNFIFMKILTEFMTDKVSHNV
ncbi:GtrA family protein [Teredinibacter sp. KSP-S5-2]|uniref:GtrA family protein n=1 Tax=Teredinibacter sp. KSP-S5-2 TaxID=3034506 RepID=UPI00293495F7|nr:GtrA family protein [Teredinibacter sp. KSP-S5-2]WNO07559.1 GtrA family protein [Teredinibacter sp. KSP-S5-2]